MISKFNIINKEKKSLRDWLEKNHLGKTNIYKLNELKAFSNEDGIINLDYVFKFRDALYINFSLLEDNSSVADYDYDLSILYEDDNIIAIDKNKGILIHSDGNTSQTLLNAVTSYLHKKYDDSYLRAVHRIDLETSGVVVFAKNILAYNYLTYQMENQLIEKEYLAYVSGYIANDGVCELYISKDRHNSKKYVGFKKATNNAITKYKVLKHTNTRTLLRINIVTGKPHQIRVTMAFLNRPIVGDKLYGNDQSKTMYLLSNMIKFNLFDKNIEIKSKKDINYL